MPEKLLPKSGGGGVLGALGQEYGCVPGGAVVGGEVGSGGIHCHSRIGLVRRSEGNAVICFRMTSQTKGAEYSVCGGGIGGGENGSWHEF